MAPVLNRWLFGQEPVYPQLTAVQLLLLLIGMVLAIAPHFLRLPSWLPVMAVAILLWRLTAGLRRWPLPGHGFRLVLATLGFAAVGFSYRSLGGETAGVALLITMLVLKLTESGTLRDGRVAGVFAVFAVAAQALYSQSIVQTAWMLLALVWLLMLQLVFTHEGLSLRQGMRSAGWLLLQSLPVAALLFVLFPRLPGPLWGIGLDDGAFTTGIAEDFRLGDISRLAQSNEVAFRVQWPGDAPPSNDLYWRGPVLWDYDGVQWRKGREPQSLAIAPRQQLASLLAETEALEYEVFLEPHNKRWLFTLDMPAPLGGITLPESRKANLSDQMQWLSSTDVSEPLRYQARSFVGGRLPLKTTSFRRALRLPDSVNPKTVVLGQQWQQQHGNASDIIAAAQRWFIGEQFRYTLEPSPLGVNQLDDFLFRSKNGFCAHFASSFAALMRAAGIPARLVAGYQGGEINPLADYEGDYMVVRQSQAHIWVEVWLNGQGWTRIDPTGWAAPGRLTDGLANTLPNELRVPSLLSLQGSVFGRLRLSYDLMNYRWQRMVLSYDGEQQLKFLGGIHPWLANIGNLIALCGLLLAALAIGYSSWLVWRDQRRELNETEKAWHQFQKRAAKHGLQQAADETAPNFMARVVTRLPEQRIELEALAQLYSELRYSDNRKGAATFRRRLMAVKFNGSAG